MNLNHARLPIPPRALCLPAGLAGRESITGRKVLQYRFFEKFIAPGDAFAVAKPDYQPSASSHHAEPRSSHTQFTPRCDRGLLSHSRSRAAPRTGGQ